MTSTPVLALPDFTKVFIIESDASGFGLGAVLMQDKHPISYFTHALSAKAIVMAIQKWRHYLLGRRFVVRTDQQSLKYLLEQREVTMDYQRWLTRIMGYDFDIAYKLGSENKVADGLSRIVQYSGAEMKSMLCSLIVPSSLQLQDIYAEIDTDQDIQEMIAKLSRHEEVKAGFSVCQGRLMYKGCLVLPKTSAYIPLILQQCHDGVLGGHSGVLRTYKRIRECFYWPQMRKGVSDYVAACEVCQTHKYSTLSPAG